MVLVVLPAALHGPGSISHYFVWFWWHCLLLYVVIENLLFHVFLVALPAALCGPGGTEALWAVLQSPQQAGEV